MNFLGDMRRTLFLFFKGVEVCSIGEMLWLAINSPKNNATYAHLLHRNEEKVEKKLKTTLERFSP